ncbi:DUF5990 family protein [Embleya sp. NPDC050493]|uniref:DUF5990 family protein n=1 Tax=Embleya sp. NPDC050493 TaxID=3363989 RepID=UPI00379D8730
MRIRIDAVDLPGPVCPPGAADPEYRNVHVAVQRRDRPGELLDPHSADAPHAGWTVEAAATRTASGLDLKGPYIQGRPGDRFVYLSWGTVDGAGAFAMFRRAKLMLAEVPTDVLAAAVRSGLLIGRLGLTDACGEPRCARVVPPTITWTAGTPE